MQTVQSIPVDRARKVNLPEGAKMAFSQPISQVFITRIRAVGFDKQTLEFQLEQIFPQPLGTQNAILGVTMEGHSAFQNSGPRKRVCWLNYSTLKAIRDGFVQRWEQVGESKVEIEGVTYEGWYIPQNPIPYKFINSQNVQLDCKIVERDSYQGRTWTNADGTPGSQRPKTAGNGGDLLIFKDSQGNDHQIYANRMLSVVGNDDSLTGVLWDEDIVIRHNNTIVGSTVRANMAKAGISLPTVPGSPAAIAAQINTQNRRPGYTSNLLTPRPEPTRSIPGADAPEVAEKTKAEELREKGERDPHSTVQQ